MSLIFKTRERVQIRFLERVEATCDKLAYRLLLSKSTPGYHTFTHSSVILCHSELPVAEMASHY